MSFSLTVDQIRRAAPHGRTDIIEAIASSSASVFAAHAIDTENRVLGLMSTILEETGGLTVIAENDNYSAERACQVFPHCFPSAAAAAPYAHNPEAFCDKVYGGRMGNVGPHDGFLYRGQGLIQITGRDNFGLLQQLTGLPLLATPAMVASPEHMLECTVALFVRYPGILAYCDAGQFEPVWALVGSGSARGPVINLQNHKNALAAARLMFAAPAQTASPGSVQTKAKAMQVAVKDFQQAAGVPDDGLPGPITLAAYQRALAA